MSDDKKDADLAILFPGVDVPVAIRGKGIEIVRVEPWYATQFALAIAKVKPLAKAIGSVAVISGDKVRIKVGNDFGEFLVRVIDSAEDGTNTLIDLLCVSLRKPREWFDGVSLDGLYELAVALFEQNRSFFVRRLLPPIQAQMAKIQETGETSSQGSSQPATAETKLTE